jgi:hypothetical protein
MYDFSRTQWQNKSFVADLIFKAATLITRALAGRHLRADISVTCCKLKFWRNESLDDHPQRRWSKRAPPRPDSAQSFCIVLVWRASNQEAQQNQCYPSCVRAWAKDES